jgi:folate-binding protein YgfZ
MIEPTTRSVPSSAVANATAICPVRDLGVLWFDGRDAEAFLQGQLSSDVAAIEPGTSQRSSYNSPSGRMLASLRLWRDPDVASGHAYGALLAADLAAPIAKRLAMFVLRSEVAIADATAAHAVLGIAGPRAAEAIADTFGAAPVGNGVVTIAGGTARLIRLPDDRFLIVAMAEAEGDLRRALGTRVVAGNAALWRWGSIRAGVPLVTAATSDRFVPQMLNWDALDGISFQKGCYPGQEIVARTRYLGRLKERLYAFHLEASSTADPGTRVFSPAFGDQPCGTIINAAPAPEGGVALLAVVQIAAAESRVVSLAAPDGPALRSVALPYSITPTEPPRRSA